VDSFAPYIVLYFTTLYQIYSSLTSNVARIVYGILISFFGGSFPVFISVTEKIILFWSNSALALSLDSLSFVDRRLLRLFG
jgi:hypothetical protein